MTGDDNNDPHVQDSSREPTGEDSNNSTPDWCVCGRCRPMPQATSYPGSLHGSEALVREAKALVNTGHVCPKILDIS